MFFPRRLARRATARAVAATLTLTLAIASLMVAAGASPSAAANPVTPGNFTGYGFDQCVAPTQKAMNRWLNYSPFLAVGIYISGDSRGCRTQPNLSPTWVRTQLTKGWRLLPITLGPQAFCNPRFPRYSDDKVINGKPGKSGKYKKARKQGRREAGTAVAAAKALGIVPGSTLWYDLEGFDSGQTRCRESALAFLSGWTYSLHKLDYVSGVYSSAGSGIKMLDDARVSRPDAFNLPDRIWIARWDGIANTSTSYIRSDGWLPGGRMKQYQGGHDEVWGGVRINIDRNYLDLGKGSFAPVETHCDGVRVNWRKYPALRPDTARAKKVTTLQCLLQESGSYAGKVNGTFNDRLLDAVHTWQGDHGLPVSDTWTVRAWMTLLADGSRPVVKVGSAGSQVRRLQRALNAGTSARLPLTGVANTATITALRAWQDDADVKVTGVLSPRQWRKLQKGVR